MVASGWHAGDGHAGVLASRAAWARSLPSYIFSSKSVCMQAVGGTMHLQPALKRASGLKSATEAQDEVRSTATGKRRSWAESGCSWA